MHTDKGAIYNRARAKQLRDFSGLLYGNITQTDIDGLIEYQNKCYIFYETKLKGNPLPFGQRLALERITDDLAKIKPTICIVSEHDIKDPNQDIYVSLTPVLEYRFRGAWHTPKDLINARQLSDWFINTFNGRNNNK